MYECVYEINKGIAQGTKERRDGPVVYLQPVFIKEDKPQQCPVLCPPRPVQNVVAVIGSVP